MPSGGANADRASPSIPPYWPSARRSSSITGHGDRCGCTISTCDQRSIRRSKTKYRVGNWSAYEQALVQRGDVTLWRSADAADAWRPSPSGRPGAPKQFSDCAIETASTCLGAQLAISVNHCPPPRDPRSRMTSVTRPQRKYVQQASRVRNWREYETGLRARGSLTVWLGLTDGKLANGNSPRPTRRTPGRLRASCARC